MRAGAIAILPFLAAMSAACVPAISFAQAQRAEIAVRGNDAFDSVKMTPKIVGGVEAPPNTYPWQVSLQRADFLPGRGHYCGASIYSQRWLVTAAHCLEKLELGDVYVTVGTQFLSPSSPRLSPSRFVIHKLYGRQTEHDYDIALIQLEQPLVLDATVQPISAIREADEPGLLGRPLMVTGWGATQEGGGAEKTLRELEVPLLASTKCSDPMRYGDKFTDRMLCAGTLEAGHDSCQGDSGGPLSTARDGTARLVGIVSWGGGCGHAGAPGVYARVSVLAPWVEACAANPDGCQ